MSQMKKKSHIKPTYKAIILDVDGTTVKNLEESLPSPRVIEAVQKARKLGVHVCLATGRPFESAKNIVKKLKLNSLLSMLNGALIVEAKTGKIVWERPLTKAQIKQILAAADKCGVGYLINDDSIDYNTPTSYTPFKPYAVCTLGTSEETVKKLKKELSKIEGIDFTPFVSTWEKLNLGICLNITHAEATKQHGILELARRLKINTHEIIGVGDGYNDFPMMMACGLRVAMGNAIPELKEIADYIAPSVDDDGVADVIEKYILNT